MNLLRNIWKLRKKQNIMWLRKEENSIFILENGNLICKIYIYEDSNGNILHLLGWNSQDSIVVWWYILCTTSAFLMRKLDLYFVVHAYKYCTAYMYACTCICLWLSSSRKFDIDALLSVFVTTVTLFYGMSCNCFFPFFALIF